MIIFHDLKVIYFQVPGTGSTTFHLQMTNTYRNFSSVSIPKNHPARELNKIHMEKHLTAAQGRMYIDSKIWNSYEKIAFVRHPFWWARSIYRKLDCLNMIDIDIEGTFEQYLRRLDKTPYFWFTDADGCVIIDTIYRTEDLNKVYAKYSVPAKHGNHAPTKRELEITASVAPLLHEKFAREYEHYDKNDTFGQEWEKLNKVPSTVRRHI